MKYLFILGRNVKLSEAEILSYFIRRGNPVKTSFLRRNGLIVEVEKPLEKEAVNFFGGVIAIVEVLIEGNLNSKLDSLDLYSGTKNNFTYALWDFASE